MDAEGGLSGIPEINFKMEATGSKVKSRLIVDTNFW